MKRFARPPSPAMLVALAALFVSLGGVSYGLATGSIDSREVKNNSLRSVDIRNNEVRGRDIRNSTIRTEDIGADQVRGPDVLESSLGQVPKANSATTASSLASQQKINYQAPAGTGPEAVYIDAGLRLTATCAATGGGTLTLTAATSVPNSTIQSYGKSAGTSNPNFDTSTNLPVNEARTVVYTEPGGQVVVLHYGALDGGLYGGATGCVVKGLAQKL